jgi:hypothetical protein
MIKGNRYFVLLAFLIALSTLIPAYAEVTSLTTDSKFYKGGSSITFSGTVEKTDPISSGITIVIFDPNNKFVTLTSALADVDTHSFTTIFDTSKPSIHNLLTLKGVYNATAFIAHKENGKTTSFVFSPDGSPVIPSPPTNLTATVTSTEIDLTWLPPQNDNGFPISGYQIDRNDGNGFNPLTKSQSTTYRDIGLFPNSEHSYRVSAINAGGTSSPSNTVVKFTLPAPIPTTPTPTTTTNSSTTPSLEELLKQRMADAQRLQELLHGQTLPSTTQSSPSMTHSVALNETVGIDDVSDNNTVQKSVSTPQNNLSSINFANFDIKNILYPAISLVGVGIVIAVIYFRKKRKLTDTVSKVKAATLPPVEPGIEEKDDDYALSILKNRLAKGEITIDEFKALKDELSEP